MNSIIIFQERRSGMAIFIMVGIREFPRATLAYIFFFNYRDTFLPIFYGSNNLKDQPADILMFKVKLFSSILVS